MKSQKHSVSRLHNVQAVVPSNFLGMHTRVCMLTVVANVSRAHSTHFNQVWAIFLGPQTCSQGRNCSLSSVRTREAARRESTALLLISCSLRLECSEYESYFITYKPPAPHSRTPVPRMGHIQQDTPLRAARAWSEQNIISVITFDK